MGSIPPPSNTEGDSLRRSRDSGSVSARGRRVAVVTGASGGIGRAIAVLLARRGHDVLVHFASRSERALETADAVGVSGGRAAVFGADLSEPGAARTLVDRTLEVFGRIDVLVNNAAVLWFGPPTDLNVDEFTRLFRVNVWGPYSLITAAAPFIPVGGRIVNISSDAPRFPRARVAAYAASKAALESLTRSFAEELGPRGVTVNAVAPGPTRTEMLEPMLSDPRVAEEFQSAAVLGRLGEPDDIARVVVFLTSPEADWVTGQVIDVTGGRVS